LFLKGSWSHIFKNSPYSEKYDKEVKFVAKVEIKAPIVEEISKNVEGAQSVVVVDYRGLTVSEDTALRKALREEGVTYKVYKNTMMTRAFEGTDFEALAPILEGPNAIAISKEDATAPARVLAKFAKTAPALELKGGIVEGKFMDQAGINEIASIPSRDELLGRLLGSFQAPITNFARVLKQIAEKDGEAAPAEAPAAE
jgi:large subunit ribosomal protein L10